MRFRLWIIAAAVVVLVVVAATVLPRITALQDWLIERGITRQVLNNQKQIDAAQNAPDAMEIILCGAGTPLNNAEAQQCIAIKIRDKILLFDVGARSPARFARYEPLVPAHITAVFITHAHSDHIAGLGELNLLSWVGGARKFNLPVYGSSEIIKVVKGFNTAYDNDSDYRVEHHGEDLVNPRYRLMQAEVFTPTETMQKVYEAGGILVESMTVPHDPVRSALSYRIKYGGRTVVISGDTVLSQRLLDAADGADVLIHEAMLKGVVANLSTMVRELGQTRIAQIFEDILDYHTDTTELRDALQQRQIGLLVLNHLVPSANPIIRRKVEQIFSDAHYPYEIAYDGLHIKLPAGSEDIEIIDLN